MANQNLWKSNIIPGDFSNFNEINMGMAKPVDKQNFWNNDICSSSSDCSGSSECDKTFGCVT